MAPNCYTDYLPQATRLVRKTQKASLSALQRHLRIGYGLACQIMDCLHQAEIVVPETDNRAYWRVSPYQVTHHPRGIAVDERCLYIDQVIELTLFFFEMYEEGNDGDTRAFSRLKPALVKNAEIRKVVLGGFFRDGMNLPQAALALHQYLMDRDLVPAVAQDAYHALYAAALAYDRPFRRVTDLQERKSRAYRRLARYYLLVHKHDTAVSNHSRVPDFFVPQAWIRPFAAPGMHPEHVVPCAYMLKKAVEFYDHGWSVDGVAQLIERWLLIIDIPKDAARWLDSGTEALRDRMPPDWDPLHGCIFARLHELHIPFQVPAGRTCSHLPAKPGALQPDKSGAMA